MVLHFMQVMKLNENTFHNTDLKNIVISIFFNYFSLIPVFDSTSVNFSSKTVMKSIYCIEFIFNS